MASKKRIFKNNKLKVFTLLALIAVAVLLYFSRGELGETWDTLRGANIYLILLLPLVQVVNYFFIGEYYRRMFGRFATKISLTRSWGVVAAMNFVNQILPSGGLSGITYLAYGFKSKVDSGKTTLIQLGRYIFAFSSYAIIGPIALFAIMFGQHEGRLNGVLLKALHDPVAITILVSFLILTVLVLAGIFWRGFNAAIAKKIGQVLNFTKIRLFRSRKPFNFSFLHKLHDDFHEGLALVKKEGWGILRPGFFMLVSAVLEITIVYVAFLAVNSHPPLAVVFLSFTAANIAGVVSVIPGDVGVHEAVMILVLSAFGVDGSVAISATLLYRVFNKFIFLPVGFYNYVYILKPAIKNG